MMIKTTITQLSDQLATLQLTTGEVITVPRSLCEASAKVGQNYWVSISDKEIGVTPPQEILNEILDA